MLPSLRVRRDAGGASPGADPRRFFVIDRLGHRVRPAAPDHHGNAVAGNPEAVRRVRFIHIHQGVHGSARRPDRRQDRVFRSGSPACQRVPDPVPDRNVRFPRLPGQPVLGQQQVQRLPGRVSRVPAVISLQHQGGNVVQRPGKNGKQLVIRRGGGQLRPGAEDPPVGFRQRLQPFLIRRHMDAGTVDIRREICHLNSPFSFVRKKFIVKQNLFSGFPV